MVEWKLNIEVYPFWRKHWNESKHCYWWWPTILLRPLMTDYLIKQFVKCTNVYAQHVINSSCPLTKHRYGKNKCEQGRNEKVFSSSFVSMYSYENFWTKSYIYYNDLSVKGKVSSHHVFFTLWGGISTWKWLFGKDLAIIKSPQQNYVNNWYTIKDVICRWINIMVAQVDFPTTYKE